MACFSHSSEHESSSCGWSNLGTLLGIFFLLDEELVLNGIAENQSSSSGSGIDLGSTTPSGTSVIAILITNSPACKSCNEWKERDLRNLT